MEKSLLDTDILSEYLKGHDRVVVDHAGRYARQYTFFAFTSVTVYEIVYGLEIKAASRQLQKALAWLSQNEEILRPVQIILPQPQSRRPHEGRAAFSNFRTA
jgi:predicted nucleic acid-binding protein